MTSLLFTLLAINNYRNLTSKRLFSYEQNDRKFFNIIDQSKKRNPALIAKTLYPRDLETVLFSGGLLFNQHKFRIELVLYIKKKGQEVKQLPGF